MSRRGESIEMLIESDQIAARVDDIAAAISAEYAGMGTVVLVGVLKGAFIFLADLARRLTIPHRVEFMALSSYQKGSSAGDVRLEMDLRHKVEGQHVIIVEDIVDSGRTLHYLAGLLASRGASSVRSCVLVRKETAGSGASEVDYLGFEVPDVWTVGYGLDYDERYRTLPYIGVLHGVP